MTRAANNNQVLSLAFFVILDTGMIKLQDVNLLTAFKIISLNTSNGVACYFFINYNQTKDSNLVYYNVPTCKLSIASATIATICLALLTAIELISVFFNINAKM